jgi:hypothetical protein
MNALPAILSKRDPATEKNYEAIEKFAIDLNTDDLGGSPATGMIAAEAKAALTVEETPSPSEIDRGDHTLAK